MIKKFVSTVALVSSMAGVSSLYAADNCVNVSAGRGGQFTRVDCEDVWNALEDSRQFPHIFSEDEPRLHPGFCFASVGNIAATMDGEPINVSTISAWTTEFVPMPTGGADAMGSVISRWIIRGGSRNRVRGVLYSQEAIAIEPLQFSELDVISAGTGRLRGAKGAIRVDSQPEFDNAGNPTGDIIVNSISGTLCLPRPLRLY